MEIIGNGFIARNLRSLEDRHADPVVLAAGVSSTLATDHAGFAREAALVHDVVRKCLADGRRIVFFSTASAAMYGAADCPGREDGPVFPTSPYGRHKLGLEAVLAASGVDYLALRLSHLVGPDQPPHQLLPTLVGQLRAGKVSILSGARRDLIDIAHVATVLDRLLSSGVSRHVVNVASGRSVPIEDIVDHLQHRLGLTADRTFKVTGGAHSVAAVSTERLRSLVPELGDFVGGPDYFRSVIDRCLSKERVPWPSQ